MRPGRPRSKAFKVSTEVLAVSIAASLTIFFCTSVSRRLKVAMASARLASSRLMVRLGLLDLGLDQTIIEPEEHLARP